MRLYMLRADIDPFARRMIQKEEKFYFLAYKMALELYIYRKRRLVYIYIEKKKKIKKKTCRDVV